MKLNRNASNLSRYRNYATCNSARERKSVAQNYRIWFPFLCGLVYSFAGINYLFFFLYYLSFYFCKWRFPHNPIPIYCVSEILCTCPQKCDEKIPLKVRTYMFKYYHALSRDRPKQEMLLLRFIEMKSLAQRLKEDNKRVQCRYKAPTCMKAIDFVIEDGEFFLFFTSTLISTKF